MEITHTETETRNVEVIDDILCNQCGKSCQAEHPGYEGLLEVTVSGGSFEFTEGFLVPSDTEKSQVP